VELIEGILWASLAALGVALAYTGWVALYHASEGLTRWPRVREYRCEGQEFGTCDGRAPHSPDCPRWTPGDPANARSSPRAR